MNNIIEFPKKDENTIMCRECKIRPATRLCDYEDGILFDAPDANGVDRMKVYKGYELIKEIAEGNIKERN